MTNKELITFRKMMVEALQVKIIVTDTYMESPNLINKVAWLDALVRVDKLSLEFNLACLADAESMEQADRAMEQDKIEPKQNSITATMVKQVLELMPIAVEANKKLTEENQQLRTQVEEFELAMGQLIDWQHLHCHPISDNVIIQPDGSIPCIKDGLGHLYKIVKRMTEAYPQ